MKKMLMAVAAALFVAVVGFSAVPVHASQITDGMNSTGAQNTGPTNITGTGGVIQTVINVMLFIVGLLSVVMIIYAGIRYVMSRGDAGQVKDAKNTIMYAVIGLVISIFAYAIVNWVVFTATGGK